LVEQHIRTATYLCCNVIDLHALESRRAATLPTKTLKQTCQNLVTHGRVKPPKLTSSTVTCIFTLTDHCSRVPSCKAYPRKVSRIDTHTSASQVPQYSWHTTCNRLPYCCPNHIISSHGSIRLDPFPIPQSKLSVDRRTIPSFRLVQSFHSMDG
jgi:hypothetical protein